MKLSAIAIICTIALAASVTAKGQQQGNKKPCSGRPEQECKEPECQPTYGNPRRSDGSDFHTSNAPLIWDFTGCFEPRKTMSPSDFDFPGGFNFGNLPPPEGQDPPAH
ncbi:hypothetical protein LRAMOSA11030 [Lichtheimia ramosa]|uniref:Secreted protein n=1 Tax=Lichtheimia ramosa TaxID=688394 RepID=A0A077WTF1_9FUNG|nr:hypothetical protein LRAMOSA11030 [Lichtheimia ramosa]